jgi:hypothetical protein
VLELQVAFQILLEVTSYFLSILTGKSVIYFLKLSLDPSPAIGGSLVAKQIEKPR